MLLIYHMQLVFSISVIAFILKKMFTQKQNKKAIIDRKPERTKKLPHKIERLVKTIWLI